VRPNFALVIADKLCDTRKGEPIIVNQAGNEARLRPGVPRLDACDVPVTEDRRDRRPRADDDRRHLIRHTLAVRQFSPLRRVLQFDFPHERGGSEKFERRQPSVALHDNEAPIVSDRDERLGREISMPGDGPSDPDERVLGRNVKQKLALSRCAQSLRNPRIPFVEIEIVDGNVRRAREALSGHIRLQVLSCIQ
jgi:hypothetical protein